MKYLEEYRDSELVKSTIDKIWKTVNGEWSIMEICGGQTHSLVKNGIIGLLPSNINMVHGPGCPVCVTPGQIIDDAIYLAENKDVILCSFGDMLRVPGTNKSLLQTKANGGDVRVVYSPLEAVKFAKKNPQKEVVFLAVGFETTAPANALSVIQAKRLGLSNYSILPSHVLVPPAIEAIMEDPDNKIDGFLAAGHVCTIMGLKEYFPIAEKYSIPIIVTGFEPVDLVQGILQAVQLLEKGEFGVVNKYSRMVQLDGNPKAKEIINEVFGIGDRNWRGIGSIPNSGLIIREDLKDLDARGKFNLEASESIENSDCIAGMVLKGQKKPLECQMFGKVCTPENPLGAPMVSSEGACAAYFHFSNLNSVA